MSDPRSIVRSFYEAFMVRDGEKMARLYGPNVKFSDPVFPNLVGNDAGNMWRMLCQRSKDLKIHFSIVNIQGSQVTVKWDAWYTFLKTGRPVHNEVTATLTVQDGKITEHHDKFNFWAWSKQALGTVGTILGWTPIIRSKVRKEAARALREFGSK